MRIPRWRTLILLTASIAAASVIFTETFTATTIVGTSTITTPSYVASGGTNPTITACNASPPTAVSPIGSMCLDTTNKITYVSLGTGSWDALIKSSGGTPNFATLWQAGNVLATSDIQQAGGFISTPTTDQITITTALTHSNVQHGAITLYTQGVALTQGDGGLQSYNSSTMDVTAADLSTVGLYGSCTSTKSAGTHLLTNYGVLVSSSGGDVNYSFFGANGLFNNNGAGHFGSTLADDGATTASGGLSIGGGQSVSLSTNVQPFAMPSGAGGTWILGGTSTIAGSPGVIQIQNTGATRNLEIDVIGNTTTTANVIPSYALYRGAGGGTSMGQLTIDDGTVISGLVANDTALASPNKIAFSSGGAVPEWIFTLNNHIQVPSVAGKPALTSCGTGASNTGSDFSGTFTTGTGATACTITFAKTYTNQPSCVFQTYGGATLPTCTPSATAITCSTAAASTTYSFTCYSQAGT